MAFRKSSSSADLAGFTHVRGDDDDDALDVPAAAIALLQGGSYLYFGLWSLLARKHYRRKHRIRSDDWVLNAHGGWLLAVGSTLVASAVRGAAARPEIRLLATTSALGLACNDLALRRRIAPIYRLDTVYELGLVAAWLIPRPRR